MTLDKPCKVGPKLNPNVGGSSVYRHPDTKVCRTNPKAVLEDKRNEIQVAKQSAQLQRCVKHQANENPILQDI